MESSAVGWQSLKALAIIWEILTEALLDDLMVPRSDYIGDLVDNSCIATTYD